MTCKVPVDYDKFLTKVSKRRGFSQLREVGKYMGDKTYTVLAGGVPSPDVFPFSGATFTLSLEHLCDYKFCHQIARLRISQKCTADKYCSIRDGSQLEFNEELAIHAQQYGRTEGFPPLLKLMRGFVERLYGPPADDWTMIITTGCQQSMCTAIEIILEEGDTIIGSEYCYSGTLDILRPLGIKYLAIEGDQYGMKPDALLRALRCCKKADAPKMIYFVPNGGNPDSVTIAAERRRQIYKITQEYDLIILEDDPYHFVLFDTDSPPISFLSLDTDGRVLRCDSISKTIAPGFRVGVLIGAPRFIETAVKHLQVSNQEPCCLSQVVLYKLLQQWGFEGFMKQAHRARDIYEEFKDRSRKYATKWLTGLVEMHPPSGGFFLWVKLKGIDDSEEICNKCITKKAIFAPGTWFTYDKRKSPYIRVSFASGVEEDFDNGFRVLAEVLRDHLQQKTTNGHITNGTCH